MVDIIRCSVDRQWGPSLDVDTKGRGALPSTTVEPNVCNIRMVDCEKCTRHAAQQV